MLHGKVAVITGGGQGIGRAIALEFARQGARVVLASRNIQTLDETRSLIQQLGAEALVVPTDVLNEANVQNLAETSLRHFGHVDILVNNSGIAGPTQFLWEMSLDEWQQTIAVNLTGAFLCCRAFLAHMTERRTGAVLMIGSRVAERPLARRTPYTASKAGLDALAKTLALEVGPFGIRVNVIAPGTVEGDRLTSVLGRMAQQQGSTLEAVQQFLMNKAALRRFTQPSDVAQMAVFLASDQATAITGVTIPVDAGLGI